MSSECPFTALLNTEIDPFESLVDDHLASGETVLMKS